MKNMKLILVLSTLLATPSLFANPTPKANETKPSVAITKSASDVKVKPSDPVSLSQATSNDKKKSTKTVEKK
jgi:hypothetical protein